MVVTTVVRVDGKPAVVLPAGWESYGWKEGAEVWVDPNHHAEEPTLVLRLVEVEHV